MKLLAVLALLTLTTAAHAESCPEIRADLRKLADHQESIVLGAYVTGVGAEEIAALNLVLLNSGVTPYSASQLRSLNSRGKAGDALLDQIEKARGNQRIKWKKLSCSSLEQAKDTLPSTCEGLRDAAGKIDDQYFDNQISDEVRIALRAPLFEKYKKLGCR